MISLQFTNQVLRSSRTPSEMYSLHQLLDQENVLARESAVERLQSRWNSSSRVIVDKPPSQPLSRKQTNGSSSNGSLKESHHKGPFANSKWTSGSGVVADSPPLQPLSRRGSSVRRLSRYLIRHGIDPGVRSPSNDRATKVCFSSLALNCDEEP